MTSGSLELFVPGRICLFGEHSDWAGSYRRINASLERGHAILVGTDQGISATVRGNPGNLAVRATLEDGSSPDPLCIPFKEEVLQREAERGGFYSYVAGVACRMIQSFDGLDGIEIDNHTTDLPIRKGLSSSAAICVLTARAFNRLYHLGLTREEEMELAYQGEIATPSRCGRLDQGCAYGSTPIHMTFDADEIEVEALECARELHMVIVDLMASKDTRKILASLHECYPFASAESQIRAQEYLGRINREITALARAAMAEGDLARIGMLMDRAQREFDRSLAPLCPSELEAPLLHGVLSDARIRGHILGGKGVGSQGDGSAQLLARTEEDRAEVLSIVEEDLGMRALPLTIKASREPSAGI